MNLTRLQENDSPSGGADDIGQRSILQPIVLLPADAAGRHRIHFGAKCYRAALRAGLTDVPIVVRKAPADPYAQVAQNQKRHGLSSLDLARFFHSRLDQDSLLIAGTANRGRSRPFRQCS